MILVYFAKPRIKDCDIILLQKEADLCLSVIAVEEETVHRNLVPDDESIHNVPSSSNTDHILPPHVCINSIHLLLYLEIVVYN